LPFQNLTGDPALDPVGRGIAEDLRDLLWNFPDFQVVSNTSSDASQDSPSSIKNLAEGFGAQFVIEGSVRRTSDKALISAQLIEGATDTQLWSDRFEESIADPVALESAVAKRLFHTFGGFTGEMRRAYERIAWSKAEADLTEYDYYVRGHTHSFHFTKDEFDRGRQIWEAGLRRFPDSVLLRIKVSFAHASDILNYWSKDPGADAVQMRKLVAEAAQLLADRRRSRFEEWFLHWGSHYRYWSERDFGRCTAEAKATLTYAPYEAFTLQDVAWGYAACGGNPDEAIAWVKEAIRLDPEGPAAGPQFYVYTLALVSYLAGRYQEAANLIENEKLEMPLLLIASYVQLGRLDEARSNMEAFVKRNPDRTLKDEANFPFPLFDPLQQRWLDDLRAAGLPEK
jgi:TolB-like protein